VVTLLARLTTWTSWWDSSSKRGDSSLSIQSSGSYSGHSGARVIAKPEAISSPNTFWSHSVPWWRVWQDSKCLASIIIGERVIFGVLSALVWRRLRSCGTFLKRSTLVPCHEWIYTFHFIFLFEVSVYLLPFLLQEDAKSISKSTFDSPSQWVYLHYEEKARSWMNVHSYMCSVGTVRLGLA
jgi:hypothetical protein